jgi:hypothetical protein
MKRIVIALTLTALLGLASLARAELIARGDLFVSFQGGIAPLALPRHELSPIRVSFKATVGTVSGESPPALRRMVIELNRAGHLDTRGLPICPVARVKATNTQTALRLCGSALVGQGSYRANTDLPEQSAFPAAGHILAFNTRGKSGPAIVAHVYGTHPFAASRIIVFHLRRLPHGPYGTVLAASLPSVENPHGYITQISLSLYREFTYRGRAHSYLSAACSAPAGFPGAVFAFARTRMSFAGGGTLASTVTRSCKVDE